MFKYIETITNDEFGNPLPEIKIPLNIKITYRARQFIPEAIRECMQRDHCVLAGGAIRAYINSEPIEDFDLYFDSKDHRDRSIDWLKATGYKETYRCPQDQLVNLKQKNIKVQCISNKYYSKPEDVINEFDFTICQFVIHYKIYDYDYSNHEELGNFVLHTTKQALKDTKKKRLVLNKLVWPIATINRINKYKSRGYSVPPYTIKRIIDEIQMESYEDLNKVYID